MGPERFTQRRRMRRLSEMSRLKDIVQRRLSLAPRSRVERTFGIENLKVDAWGSDDLLIILLGTSRYIEACSRRAATLETPLPGFQPPRGVGIKPTFDVVDRKILHKQRISGFKDVMWIHPGADCTLHQVEVQTPQVIYHIETAFIGGDHAGEHRLTLLDSFELALVRLLGND
jgi:hypothetical protein